MVNHNHFLKNSDKEKKLNSRITSTYRERIRMTACFPLGTMQARREQSIFKVLQGKVNLEFFIYQNTFKM